MGERFTEPAAHGRALLVGHLDAEVLTQVGTGLLGPLTTLFLGQRGLRKLLHQRTDRSSPGFGNHGETVTDFGRHTNHRVRHTSKYTPMYTHLARQRRAPAERTVAAEPDPGRPGAQPGG